MREYLAALGIAAVYVAVSRSQRRPYVGSACDPARAQGTLRGRTPGITIEAAFWVIDSAVAADLAERANARLAPPTNLAYTLAAILEAAREAGIVLTTHAAVMARAGAVVRRVETEMARARLNGRLQLFNRGYRSYRLECEANGRRPIGYPQAYAKLRLALLASIADRSAARGRGAVTDPGTDRWPTVAELVR